MQNNDSKMKKSVKLFARVLEKNNYIYNITNYIYTINN